MDASGRLRKKDIYELQAHLRGEIAVAPVAKEEGHRFHVGAIWYGDWYRRAERNTRFGCPDSPNHYAAIRKRISQDTRFAMAPITSRKQGGAVVLLPRGYLPTGHLVSSYLLPRHRLLASRKSLAHWFSYRMSLEARYIEQMQRISEP